MSQKELNTSKGKDHTRVVLSVVGNSEGQGKGGQEADY
jgi:hypothetical protein